VSSYYPDTDAHSGPTALPGPLKKFQFKTECMFHCYQ